MGPGLPPFENYGRNNTPAAREPDPAIALAREREVFDLQQKRRGLLSANGTGSAPLGAPLGGGGARLLGA